jgi:hypothetical protein
MIWKAIALFGAGSFFYVGWGVLTDPLCNSVSFRGGGARTVVTTCFPDSRGDFSKASAVTGSFLIGLAILAILFWPLIKAYIANSKFQLSLKQMAREIENSQDIEVNESNESPQEPTQKDSLISTSIRKVSENKLISIALIAVLIFGFYQVVAPKISLLNPITCSGLKEELANKDALGRQLWNSYQTEVSNLSMVEMYSDAYYLQVGNSARRALQLNLNDVDRYSLLKSKPHCVKNLADLSVEMETTNLITKYLQGTGTIDGKSFSVDIGWNADYYRVYIDFIDYIK